jgi:hypothetical protein
MRLPPDPISETSVMRLIQRMRRIELREAGENVVDLLREREAKAVREEMELAEEAREENAKP